jgi:hypothetical protein
MKTAKIILAALVAFALPALVGCSTTTGIASRHVGTVSINAKAGKDIVFNLREIDSTQEAEKTQSLDAAANVDRTAIGGNDAAVAAEPAE